MTQDLEPRAYWPTPVGTTFLVVSDSQSSGSAVVDATSPFSDVHASFSVASLGAGRVFDLWGKQANLLLALPYAWGDVSGDVGGTQHFVTRSGLADTRVSFSTCYCWGHPRSGRLPVRPSSQWVSGSGTFIKALWIFEDNDDFYGGHRRAEDPIASTQLHLNYTIWPRLWLAADATYLLHRGRRHDRRRQRYRPAEQRSRRRDRVSSAGANAVSQIQL